MGTSLKESLRDVIDQLTDEEAREILEYTDHLRMKREREKILKQLEGNPAFTLPAKDIGPFPEVKAVKGKGIPASELLSRERR
jgi:hypothetical protein